MSTWLIPPDVTFVHKLGCDLPLSSDAVSDLGAVTRQSERNRVVSGKRSRQSVFAGRRKAVSIRCVISARSWSAGDFNSAPPAGGAAVGFRGGAVEFCHPQFAPRRSRVGSRRLGLRLGHTCKLIH